MFVNNSRHHHLMLQWRVHFKYFCLYFDALPLVTVTLNYNVEILECFVNRFAENNQIMNKIPILEEKFHFHLFIF